jgi:hypothetical protein
MRAARRTRFGSARAAGRERHHHDGSPRCRRGGACGHAATAQGYEHRQREATTLGTRLSSDTHLLRLTTVGGSRPTLRWTALTGSGVIQNTGSEKSCRVRTLRSRLFISLSTANGEPDLARRKGAGWRPVGACLGGRPRPKGARAPEPLSQPIAPARRLLLEQRAS